MRTLIVPVSWNSAFKNSASERFRCDWLLPHLPAEKYDGSQDPNDFDVVIYQKGFRPDMLAKQHGLLTVFDATDPFWLVSTQSEIGFLFDSVDLITVSTRGLADSLEKICPIPVYVIPDGHNLQYYSVAKVHSDRRPTFVWYGYSQNWEQVEDLLGAISGYNLIVISDKPVGMGRWIKWDVDTVNAEIIQGDIVLCPPDPLGFKSNNKKITAWALGMPVAETPQDVFKFLKYAERELDQTKHTWDVIERRVQASAEKLRNTLVRALELTVVGRQLNGA